MNGSRLLIDEQPLQVVPSLACKMGLNRAMFLQQLHYWLQKSKHVRDGRSWVFNTYEGWHEQFPFWSAQAIKKIVLQLEARGIIETTDRYNKRGTDRTKWYTIDYDALNALFVDEDEAEGPEDSEGAESNDEGAESNALEGAESTERYQRVPETNNRDSDLQSGDGRASQPAPTNDEVKPVPMGKHAVAFLMDRLKESRAAGAHPPPLTNRQRGEYGEFFAQAVKDGESIADSEMALRWLVAKACGEIEHEPEAWAYFGSAQRAVRDGWRPKRHLRAVRSPEADAEREREWAEIEAMTAEILKGIG